MVLCDAKKLKAEDIDDINDLANFLVDMSPKDLTSNGGFYIYVNEGQGIAVPPLYLIAQTNFGHLKSKDIAPNSQKSCMSDILDPRRYLAMFLTL